MKTIITIMIFINIWLIHGLDWRIRLKSLIYFIPFLGIPIFIFYPNPYSVLIKDFAFIIPIYATIIFTYRKDNIEVFPKALSISLVAFSVIALLASFNPNIPRTLVALIGLKVWLFNIPMIYVGFKFVNSIDDIEELLKYIVKLSCIPAIIGIIIWTLCASFGAREVIPKIYGEKVAMHTTQRYATPLTNNSVRVPSTFPFVTQYFYYLFSVLPCIFMLYYITSKGWKKYSLFCGVIVIIASFLSGARVAFIAMPTILIFMYLFKEGIKSLPKAGIIIYLLFTIAFFYSSISKEFVFDRIFFLVKLYARETTNQFVDAFKKNPLGNGTGMNTGAARYAYETLPEENYHAIEGFYAKLIAEFGFLGLFIRIFIFLQLLNYNYSAYIKSRGTKYLPIMSATLGLNFVIPFLSMKGWPLHTTPLDVYYWLLNGIMIKCCVILKVKNV